MIDFHSTIQPQPSTTCDHFWIYNGPTPNRDGHTSICGKCNKVEADIPPFDTAHVEIDDMSDFDDIL